MPQNTLTDEIKNADTTTSATQNSESFADSFPTAPRPPVYHNAAPSGAPMSPSFQSQMTPEMPNESMDMPIDMPVDMPIDMPVEAPAMPTPVYRNAPSMPVAQPEMPVMPTVPVYHNAPSVDAETTMDKVEQSDFASQESLYEQVSDEAAEQLKKQPDLLSQIMAEDQVDENTKKRSIAFSTILLVAMMKTTFFIDAFTHKYAKIFSILRFIWASFMMLLYAGGIGVLVLLSYVYMKLPNFIEYHLKSNTLPLNAWVMDKYDFSNIELSNLSDTERTYTIDSIALKSTFADFLNQKIKVITIDGLKATLTKKDGAFNTKNIMLLINSLTNHKSFSVNSVAVSDGLLTLKGDDFNIPIQFSMTGLYDNNVNLWIPFLVKDKNVNLSGMLTITGEDDSLTWTIDINSGTITMENFMPSNIMGNLIFKTTDNKLTATSGDLTTSYGGTSRKITYQFKNSKNNLLTGNINLALNTKSNNKFEKDMTADMNFAITDLNIKNLNELAINKPIRINITKWEDDSMSLKELSTSLRGNLTCTNFNCAYKTNAASPVQMEKATFFTNEGNLTSSEKISFNVAKSNREDTFYWDNKEKKLNINILLSNLLFNAHQKASNDKIRMSIFKTSLIGGVYLQDANNSKLSLTTGNSNIENTLLKMTGGTITIQNILDTYSAFSVKADSVQLKNNQMIKLPFELDLQKNSKQTDLTARFLNNLIQVNLKGDLNFSNHTFNGAISIPAFSLDKINTNLNAISDIFPDYVENPTGQIMAFGKINWATEREINGPLYVSLKDVSFNVAQLDFNKLNTVLAFKTVAPLVSLPAQEIFIEKVSGILPLQNVQSNIKIEQHALRINDITADIASIPVEAKNIVVPYNTDNVSMTLASKAFDWSNITPFIKVPNLNIKGSTQLTLPIELKDRKLSLKNGSIQVSTALLKYTGANAYMQRILNNATSYLISGGSIIIEGSNQDNLDIYLNTTGRLLPSQTARIYRDATIIDINDIIKQGPVKPITNTILNRQKIIAQ